MRVVAGLAVAAVLACIPGSGQASPLGAAPPPGPPVAVHPERWPVVSIPVPRDPEVEQRVEELLAAMSLEAKVGQVIQAEIGEVTPADVRRYRLGSVLNGGGSPPGGNRRATPRDWLELADAFYDASVDHAGGGLPIPVVWGTDAVHGHNNVIGATVFPHNIGLGATRDVELIRRIGEITALEMRVTGLDWNFAPTVAVVRDDRWGRTYEGFSEDPGVVRACAAAIVVGLQGTPGSPEFLGARHVIATAKHFLGDGGTAGGRDTGDNLSSEEELRDVHAAGYVAALEAGVQTVMASFSSWHGRKMHGNRDLLTVVLKGRMGFDGFVIGDWNGHGKLPGCSDDDCPAAFVAGVDMYMVPKRWKALYRNTLAQVRSGAVPEARLDDAVRRILRVKVRAGMLEQGRPSSRPLAGRTELLGSSEHRAVARRAVRSSLVLLKNEKQLLPLRRDLRVLVAGDAADSIPRQCGGWTVTWQGTETTNADFPGGTSIWQGIRQVVESGGGAATRAVDGRFTERPDVAIVVFGEEPYAETDGDRPALDFGAARQRDRELLRRLHAAGVRVVSVFLSGRPMWVNPELNASDAFVAAWLPGTEGGGVADLLFRAADGSIAHDFTGRLAYSWPRWPDRPAPNRGDAQYDPLFPFGFGLSVTDDVELPALPEGGGAGEPLQSGGGSR
jgi:beta-glucosidase